MRGKIFRSMCVLSAVAVLLTAILISLLLYNDSFQNMKSRVKMESEYIQLGMELEDISFLKQIDKAVLEENQSRVTLIAADGAVLYDSAAAGALSNHLDRPEIQKAMQDGIGEESRMSETLSTQTYYYAVRLQDGSILRISSAMSSVWTVWLHVIPFILGVVVLVFALSLLMAIQQTRKIVRPINQLNLEAPADSEIYSELKPLLQRIEKQNATIKRQIAEIKAEHAQREQFRREFSANVSHELKTPLNVVSGYAEMMQAGLIKPEDTKQIAGKIYTEARRLIVLVEDIIKLSRLDEQGGDLSTERCRMQELAEEVVESLSLTAGSKRVTLRVEGEDFAVVGVRQILSEMIYNLCDNAIKYNKPGGWVTVTLGKEEAGPFLSVSDTGIGIPAKERERVFERFYRVDKSRSKTMGGTGLGLSIVKHGAEYHQATVVLESTEGLGTTVKIVFAKQTN